MGHLNELKHKYAERGLVILGVARESKAAVEAFVEETKAEYPFLIEDGATRKAYGITSIPHAALIGPSGRVVWKGNPGSLQDSIIEEQLDKARLLPELPSALSSVGKDLAKQKYASARGKAEKACEHKYEDVQTAAKAVVEWIDWFSTSTMESAALDDEKGKAYDAWLAYELVADAYKGLDIAKDAEAKAKALEKDDEKGKAIDAGRKFAKLMEDIEGQSPKKALRKVEPYVKKYEGTPHGDRAKEMLAELEKAAD